MNGSVVGRCSALNCMKTNCNYICITFTLHLSVKALLRKWLFNLCIIPRFDVKQLHPLFSFYQPFAVKYTSALYVMNALQPVKEIFVTAMHQQTQFQLYFIFFPDQWDMHILLGELIHLHLWNVKYVLCPENVFVHVSSRTYKRQEKY